MKYKSYLRETAAVLLSAVISLTGIASETVQGAAAQTAAEKETGAGKANVQDPLEKNTRKEEIVYINLEEDGTVSEVNVVNSFELEEAGEIIDYGDYTSLRNMTSTDEIREEDGRVTIDTRAGKLYYEGKLEDTAIPWKFSFHYYLDGKEYPAEELAGKSGALEITMSIQENEKCRGTFFDDYALQLSVTLNTEQAENIAAEGATAANVGTDKQLTYTILPGTEKDLSVTADVTDFEMEGIAINGVRLNMDIEVDDEELLDQVTELLDAIEKIDDGTEELSDGTEELQEGAQTGLQEGAASLADGSGQLQNGAGALVSGGQTLTAGTGSLTQGAENLDSGIGTLKAGLEQVQAGLDALAEQSDGLTEGSAQVKSSLKKLQKALNGVKTATEETEKLVSASAQIKQGISDLKTGAAELQAGVSFEAYKAVMAQNGLSIDDLMAGNTAAAQSISALLGEVGTIEALLAQLGIPAETIQPWEEQAVGLANQVAALLQANNAAIAGMDAYLGGVSQGASQLASGAQSLEESYAEFDTAIGELADTLSELITKTDQLREALNALVKEYEKLDTGLNAYTGGVKQAAAGLAQISSGTSALVSGSSELKSGSYSLYLGTAELLGGIVELYEATGTLKSGAGELEDGVGELLTAIIALNDGASELKDGTEELRSETDGMDEEISDKIDELLETVSGGSAETVSFVSEKNTEIESVQFVIKTDAVEIPEEEEEPEEQEEEQGLWQKLTGLF